jgi:hypothetical protein
VSQKNVHFLLNDSRLPHTTQITFAYIRYLEETKSKEAALDAESRLVANVRYWMGVAAHAKQEKEEAKKGGNANKKEKEKEADEDNLKLIACLPRLKLFARFLALDGVSGAAVNLVYNAVPTCMQVSQTCMRPWV